MVVGSELRVLPEFGGDGEEVITLLTAKAVAEARRSRIVGVGGCGRIRGGEWNGG